MSGRCLSPSPCPTRAGPRLSRVRPALPCPALFPSPIRREANTCSICWFPANPAADFAVSGPGMMGITKAALCCGYGASGLDQRGYDCLIIPMASTMNNVNKMIANRFCGASKGLATIGSQLSVGTTTNTALDRSICCKFAKLVSKHAPSLIHFPISSAFQLNICPSKSDLCRIPTSSRTRQRMRRRDSNFSIDSGIAPEETRGTVDRFQMQIRIQFVRTSIASTLERLNLRTVHIIW